MLKLLEVSSEEKLEEYKKQEDNKFDYLYILKYTGELLLSDNGKYISICGNGSGADSSNLIASDGTRFKFGIDDDGNYGYILKDDTGADTVIPFKKDVPYLEEIYYGTSDPINYTYTVSKEGYYLACGVRGDNGGSITTTGTVLYHEDFSNIRTELIYFIYCKAGDTIKLQFSNYSSAAYRGNNAFILKISQKISFKNVVRKRAYDNTISNTITVPANSCYLFIQMSCGTGRNSSISNSTTCLQSSYAKDSINCRIIKTYNNTVSVSSTQHGETAGSAIILVYKIQ